jgi:hypothetical protein
MKGITLHTSPSFPQVQQVLTGVIEYDSGEA